MDKKFYDALAASIYVNAMALNGKSIAEVSEALGYASSQSFSRAFRRVMKKSPAQMMKYCKIQL